MACARRGRIPTIFFRSELRAEVIKNEEPNRGRQVTVLSVRVDGRDKLGQSHLTRVGDLLEPFPERVFKADTCLVSGDHD
jgi:hypothetical protein